MGPNCLYVVSTDPTTSFSMEALRHLSPIYVPLSNALDALQSVPGLCVIEATVTPELAKVLMPLVESNRRLKTVVLTDTCSLRSELSLYTAGVLDVIHQRNITRDLFSSLIDVYRSLSFVQAVAHEKPRLLCVDDDPFWASEVVSLCEEFFDCKAIVDQTQAVQNIVEFKPHIVLLDLVIGGSKTGFDLYDEIRPIIGDECYVFFATNVRFASNAVEALSRGAQGYLYKPFNDTMRFKLKNICFRVE